MIRATTLLAAAVSICWAIPASGQLSGVPVQGFGQPVTRKPALVTVLGHHYLRKGAPGIGSPPDGGGALSLQRWFAPVVFRASVGAVLHSVTAGDDELLGQYAFAVAACAWHKPDRVTFERQRALLVVAGYGYSALPDEGSERNLFFGLEYAKQYGFSGFFFDVSLLPRWQLQYTRDPADSEWQHGIGVSATFAPKLGPWGLGAVLAVDWRAMRHLDGEPLLPPRPNGIAASLGLSMAF